MTRFFYSPKSSLKQRGLVPSSILEEGVGDGVKIERV